MPLLFSYGTLQEEAVQRSIFGRVLRAESDALVGWVLAPFEVKDPSFVATSGKSTHNILHFSGRDTDRVSGSALDVTDQELALSDAYEPVGYKRVLGRLASGRETWVYVADDAQ